jgi:antitoxin CcdA
MVVKYFPPGRTTTSRDVAWNRWKLRQRGKLAPKMPKAPGTASVAARDYQYLHDALTTTYASQAVKKPVNLSISNGLLAAAKALNINLSETLERGLITLLSQEARVRWLSENREALEAHDRFVERHGLWSDGLRQF